MEAVIETPVKRQRGGGGSKILDFLKWKSEAELELTLSGPQGFCLAKIFCFLIFCSGATNYVTRFWENFVDTGVPMVFKGSISSLVGWKCSRLIYLKIC